ncbi:MAG: hypothetical protein V1873_07800 [Verrucomicrobiota bacterium]
MKAERALKKAVSAVVEEHRRLGLPIAIMRKGKAVFVSAEKALAAVREDRASYAAKGRK